MIPLLFFWQCHGRKTVEIFLTDLKPSVAQTFQNLWKNKIKNKNSLATYDEIGIGNNHNFFSTRDYALLFAWISWRIKKFWRLWICRRFTADNPTLCRTNWSSVGPLDWWSSPNFSSKVIWIFWYLLRFFKEKKFTSEFRHLLKFTFFGLLFIKSIQYRI